MNPRWWSVLFIALALGLGTIAHLRTKPIAPAKRDPTQAQTWMVDSLPGVGGKRLQAAQSAVRDRRVTDLPKAARTEAHELFLDP